MMKPGTSLMVVLALTGLTGAGLAASPQDLQVAERIQQRLVRDGGPNSDRILVQVDDGRVVLLGTVETAQMKETATSAAMSVPGVQMIENNLSVAGENPSDSQLEASVMHALRRSALTADSTIVAHATKGEITLEGAVPSDLAQREATRLAQTIIGVKGIRNRLSVTNAQTAGVSSGY